MILHVIVSSLSIYKCLHSHHSEIQHNVNDTTKDMNSGITVYCYLCTDSKNKALFPEARLSKQYPFVICVIAVQIQHYSEQSKAQIHHSQIKAKLPEHQLPGDNAVREATSEGRRDTKTGKSTKACVLSHHYKSMEAMLCTKQADSSEGIFQPCQLEIKPLLSPVCIVLNVTRD